MPAPAPAPAPEWPACGLTGLEGLVHLARDLKLHQVDLHLSELKGPVSDRLDAAGLSHWLTGQIFLTQHDAQVALAAS